MPGTELHTGSLHHLHCDMGEDGREHGGSVGGGGGGGGSVKVMKVIIRLWNFVPTTSFTIAIKMEMKYKMCTWLVV